METALPWLLATLFASAAIVAFLVLRRVRARHRRALDQERRETAANLAAVEAGHATAIAEEREQREAAESLAESARAALTRGIRWEAASRAVLVDACNRLGLDAVVATNVAFVPLDAPASRPFVAQIDHVVVTSTFVLMVENKRWQGVVLDSVHPQEVSNEIAVLTGPLDLTPPFAVHLQPRGAGKVEIRVAEGSEAPQAQVRKQAWRFARLLGDRVGSSPYVNTMVLYSHPNARVHHAVSADTFVVADGRQLDRVLRQLSRSQRKGAESLLEPIASQLETAGADMVGTGSLAARWASPLPLAVTAEGRGLDVYFRAAQRVADGDGSGHGAP